MNQRVVNVVAGRLSLRPPQRRSLEILARLTEFVSPCKAVDREAALAAINAEWPTVAAGAEEDAMVERLLRVEQADEHRNRHPLKHEGRLGVSIVAHDPACTR